MRIDSVNNCSLGNSKNSSLAFGYSRTKLGREIDTFVKLEKPSKVQTRTMFNKLLDFVANRDKSEKRIIGSGCNGTVYKIDDKYVLKAPWLGCDKIYPKLLQSERFEELKTYFGSALLDFSGGLQVLRNVSSNGKHYPVGIPVNDFFMGSMDDIYAHWNKNCLERYADLPQKSFDALARDFATLNAMRTSKNSYTFDMVNPNNVVIVGKNTLRIVDVISSHLSCRHNSITWLMAPFLDEMCFLEKAPRTPENAETRLRLIKKLIMAGERYELPYLSRTIGGVPLKEEEEILSYILDDFCNWQDLVEDMHGFRQFFPNKKTRLNKMSILLDVTLKYQPKSLKIMI